MGLLMAMLGRAANAHTGHPHGTATMPPTNAPAVTATESHSPTPHSAMPMPTTAHPYGAVVIPAVQLAEQVEFTAVAAAEANGPIAQLASPEGVVGLGETIVCLMLGAPLLLYVARDRQQNLT